MSTSLASLGNLSVRIIETVTDSDWIGFLPLCTLQITFLYFFLTQKSKGQSVGTEQNKIMWVKDAQTNRRYRCSESWVAIHAVLARHEEHCVTCDSDQFVCLEPLSVRVCYCVYVITTPLSPLLLREHGGTAKQNRNHRGNVLHV